MKHGMSFSERWRDYWRPKEAVDTSPKISDEVKYTTCYMCACRCGIKVHLRDGSIRFIEGNPKHPVNRGVICGKGASGIMQQQSPAKLRKPLLRVGERGSGEFKEIEWDEAIATAVEWLSRIRAEDPKKLAFFTGRDQSQSLTGFWATQFGTPNFAAHGGFCSVNMAAAGMYTLGGSFWEFGEPDWERTQLFLMFGVPRTTIPTQLSWRCRGCADAAPNSSLSIPSEPGIRRLPTNGSASGRAPTASLFCH
jgi:sulfite dehydrogenase (quinone) subunit SoeA